MTVVSAALLTLVVWAVSLIRSVRWQALVYSLPIPMSLVLVTTGVRVDGAQAIGVLVLVSFFGVVTMCRAWLHLHIALAVAAGAAWYVGVSIALARLGDVPMGIALLVVVPVWAAAVLVLRRRSAAVVSVASASVTLGPASPEPGRAALPVPLRLLVVFLGAFSMLLLGDALSGFIVTFPYSGVLIAFEARHRIAEFSRQVVTASIGLVAFVTGYYLGQDISGTAALAAGWAAFLVTAAACRVLARS
ncbi:hypothetical protein [Antribacter gilvus]|uniref:hypothetical protein n=1 Tax=Antribacter gilvus TaxID=2304675 RepID=UPI000F7B58E0|nr:hypothetical protein [Antribacter gilvus]